MPLALLHSLLLQQSFYGRNAFINDHHWTLSDMAMAVDVFKKVVSKSTSTEKIMDMVAKAYSDHCTDSTDAKVVQSLVSILVQYATGKQVSQLNLLKVTLSNNLTTAVMPLFERLLHRKRSIWILWSYISK